MPRKKSETDSMMRIATIVKQRKIRPYLAEAVMVHHGLKSTDRMGPDRFVQLVEAWRRQPAGGR